MSLGLRPIPSIIPACDVSLSQFEELVSVTHDLTAVGAYKIGAALCLSAGVGAVVRTARKYTNKPLIYDHQKGGTDVPDTAVAFADVMHDAGVDAVILFPLAGPTTQRAWTSALLDAGLGVIVGAHMTHGTFLVSEGGYIAPTALKDIIAVAAKAGVRDFVVPGTKPDVIREVRSIIDELQIDVVYYSPGLIAQGGVPADVAAATGPAWHAIVGRAIYEADDMRTATVNLANHLHGSAA